MGQIPLELISNFISMVILIMIFVKYYQYKQKLDVLKGLDDLKNKKKLTADDKSFISSNLKDYQILFARDEQRVKLAYPIFILVAGIVLAFLEFKEAMIHLNVIVVAFIFMQVNKIHNRNFVNLLTKLNK
ncbi:hypothetical protein CRV02_07070 [Arcobacter sp. CECT 8989]|uniref:hypothetical protein n=1 Tax=Arcobacter sp. CECT 8989 TaxID=2044509 RepID=UPI00100A629E|nr:hypothetical protein [Arcobacter sp. CECT 8989]RXK01634.1 hypothetical protein CRV02_07070 [Arcobacter sp. CECT 8989]